MPRRVLHLIWPSWVLVKRKRAAKESYWPLLCSVPDALEESAGLKADEWVRATLEVCGGRGGGRPTNAQGQIPECTNVEEVMKASETFVADKGGAVAQ